MSNNLSLLELDFDIGRYNGTMDMTVMVNGHCAAKFNDIQEPVVSFRHYITWPSTVTIIVSGKDLNCDTQVDDSGKIIADKYIELHNLRVDHMEPGVEYMKTVTLDTGSDTISTLYWGFNGQVVLRFDHDDSFSWHLAQRVQQNQGYVIAQTRI